MNNRLCRSDYTRIERLWNVGLNLQQICHLVGRSRPTVQKALGELGIAWATEAGRPTERAAAQGPSGEFWHD